MQSMAKWWSFVVLFAASPALALEHGFLEVQDGELSPDQVAQRLEGLRIDALREGVDEALKSALELLRECEQLAAQYKPDDSARRSLEISHARVGLLCAELYLRSGKKNDALALLRSLDQKVVKSAALQADVQRLQDWIATITPDAGQSKADEIVRFELDRGNAQGVLAMGSVAIPGIEAWLLENPYWLPNPQQGEQDPFALLSQIDPRRAGTFALANYDLGPLWRKRVAGVMSELKILTVPGHWSEELPRVCHLPDWLQVLERFIEDPLLGAEVMETVLYVVGWGGTTPRLRKIFGELLAHDDSRRTSFINVVLRKARFQEDMRPWLEEALASQDASLRLIAAKALARFGPIPALLALAGDGQQEMRLAVASSLRPEHATPSADPLIRKVVEQLIGDPSEEVRSHAYDLLIGKSGEYLGAHESLFLRWAKDPSRDLRAALAANLRNMKLPNESLIQLLVAMADDVDGAIVEYVDSFISRGYSHFPRYLPVLEARLLGTNHPFRKKYDREHIEFLFEEVANSAEGPNWLARCGAAWPDEEMLGFVRKAGRTSTVKTLKESLWEPYLNFLLRRDLDYLVELTAEVFNHNLSQSLRDTLRDRFLTIARNSQYDPRLRLVCASVAGIDESALKRDLCILTMTDPNWRPGGQWQESSWLAGLLAERSATITNVDQNQIVIDVLGSAQSAPAMQHLAAGIVRPTEEHGVGAAKLVLMKLLDQPGWIQGVDRCIASLGRIDLPNEAAILRRMLAHPDYALSAMVAIQDSRDVTFIPDLVATLIQSEPGDDLGIKALDTLSSYLSEAAANALLAAAEGARPNWLPLILGRVESYRKFQKARADLVNTGRSAPTRQSAMLELLELVASQDTTIRAAAARGLGSLGAVETIPNLIRLLADPEPTVREAAQAALTRLEKLDPTPVQPQEPPTETSDG